jgi:Ca2+-binding EF-hand superfamily protein
LKNYVQAFKRHDTDNDGIINEEEFLQLLNSLDIFGDNSEDETLRLLNIIDPYNNKQITFSETIALFSMVKFIINF